MLYVRLFESIQLRVDEMVVGYGVSVPVAVRELVGDCDRDAVSDDVDELVPVPDAVDVWLDVEELVEVELLVAVLVLVAV